MGMKVYSVYDAAAEAYTQPFFCTSAGLAVRAFEQAANEEGHNFWKHSADFTLFEIGDFDQQSGMIVGRKVFTNLGTATEHKRMTRRTAEVMEAGGPGWSDTPEGDKVRQLHESPVQGGEDR